MKIYGMTVDGELNILDEGLFQGEKFFVAILWQNLIRENPGFDGYFVDLTFALKLDIIGLVRQKYKPFMESFLKDLVKIKFIKKKDTVNVTYYRGDYEH